MFRIICFLFFWGVCINFLIAQDTTALLQTEKDSIVLLSSESNIYQQDILFKKVELANLNGFQHYRNYRTALPVAHLGNNGLAYNYYGYQNPDYGIYGAAPAYSHYFFKKENINYYQTNMPITNFGYMIGAEAESYLKLFHTQNFGKYLNISANYHRLHSEGFYFRQLARQSLFNTTANFTTRDSSYKAKAFFAYNSVEAFENGGLNVPDTADISNTNADLLSIALQNAESITQNHSYFFGHTLDLSSIFGFSEGIAALEHEFHYTKIFRRYTDQADSSNAIYDHFYFNNSKTYDSTYAREYYNTFGISFLSGLFSVQYKRMDGRYFQNFLLQENIQSEFFIVKSLGKIRSFNYGIYLEKGFSGFSKKALNFRSFASLNRKNGDKIELQFNYSKKRPAIFLTKYKVNHLFYDANFKQVISMQPSLQYHSKNWNTSIKVGLNEIENFIYFDSSASSQQINEVVFNPYVKVSNKLNIGSKMVLNNEILYQQIDKNDLLALPNLVSSHALYYQNIFFKETMLFQTGFEFHWVDDYTSIAYFPESNRMHLLQTGKKLGEIKQLDFFVNARIDNRFRLCIKLENLSGNSNNLNDFRVVGYPIPGKVYKVVLSWLLVN